MTLYHGLDVVDDLELGLDLLLSEVLRRTHLVEFLLCLMRILRPQFVLCLLELLPQQLTAGLALFEFGAQLVELLLILLLVVGLSSLQGLIFGLRGGQLRDQLIDAQLNVIHGLWCLCNKYTSLYSYFSSRSCLSMLVEWA